MPSPELNPNFRKALDGLPSLYQLKDRESKGKESLDDVMTVLPVGVDEFAEITTSYGCPIVGRIDMKGVYEIEIGWYPDPHRPKMLLPQQMHGDHDRIQFRDLGNGSIGTSLWNAHAIRRELVGHPAATLEDIELLYKREMEFQKPEDVPFITLREDVPFGDFIENYPHISNVHPGNDLDFWDASKDVMLRPDLYMEIDSYAKRKGWIRPSDALDPSAIYHEQTGFLRVFLDNEWDIGVWFNFGGDLEENPHILQLVERPTETSPIQICSNS
ncbi:MAG: hypothetical protein KBC00_04270 [Candidatus Levybacteria bacterium]|nr:hypothetical protein [Candidatus Levybacteria bacterium]